MTGEKTKKRAQRATSNVFAMFEQNQIAEFKEVRLSSSDRIELHFALLLLFVFLFLILY